MKSSKIFSIAIVIINIIGIICMVYYAVPLIVHDTTVENPDAMLPLESWDASGFVLWLGITPLLVANILAFLFVAKEKLKLPLRLMFFIPSLICIGLVVFYLLSSFTIYY